MIGMRPRLMELTVAIVVAAATNGLLSAAAPTAVDSLAKLKIGNARFVSNPQDALPISAARRTDLTKGQTPFATILSCADSRVPPEVVFHTGEWWQTASGLWSDRCGGRH